MRDSDENTYDFDMIYLGRLTYQKDPQRLMRLSAALKARKPDIKVAVVGAGELEEETKALCRELDLQDNVHFLGFQSNPIKMVADSKAMILTSRWEGTPMCALEAMALGTPVVSTPSDGMKDLIENGVDGYLSDEDAVLAEDILKSWKILTIDGFCPKTRRRNSPKSTTKKNTTTPFSPVTASGEERYENIAGHPLFLLRRGGNHVRKSDLRPAGFGSRRGRGEPV